MGKRLVWRLSTFALAGFLVPAVFCAALSYPPLISTPPENASELSPAKSNALKRIAQLAYVQWRPVLENTMPSRRGFFSGRPVIGVPYSSARFPGRRIGYDVSLETFMTAVQNPKSVLYTENLREEPYKIPNSATFYGLACSSLVQWAFRSDFSYGTRPVHNNPERANMRLLEEQSAAGVELLDILNTIGGGHQEIITNISYSDGKITSIEVTDLASRGVRVRPYTPEQFNRYVKDRNYLLYRYNIPEEIPYTPSKYVAVWDEEPQEIVYNRVLALDRGNRTNYERGLPVKFNIMDENAASLVVKRDGSVIDTTAITGTGVIEKMYLEHGKYEARCVMKDGSKSDPVEFIIAEVKVSAPQRVKTGEEILIPFSTERCGPGHMANPTLRTLTEEERSGGFVRIPARRRTGSFSVVIKGVNEFGSVFSERRTVRVVNR